jgi:hypothetical protein
VRFLRKSGRFSKLQSPTVAELNENTLSYVELLGQDEICRRLEKVLFAVPKSSADVAAIGATLAREGIVVIPGFLTKQVALEIEVKIKDLISFVRTTDPEGTGFQDENIIIQGKNSIVAGYKAAAEHSKTIVSIRQGVDQGMLDVFNADRILGNAAEPIFSVFNQSWLKTLTAQYAAHLRPSNLNVYVNEGVVKTRGMHVDDFYSTIKGFVYLTDVNSLSDGPYCYVKGSHKESKWRDINKAISEASGLHTECPIVPLNKVLPVLGEKGTLVLSDQSGFHRGIPQEPKANRKLLVMRYR